MEIIFGAFRWIMLLGFCFSINKMEAQIDTGTYSGFMHLMPKTLGLDSIEVSLQIQKTNDTLYVWKMSYSNSMEKNYRLIVKNETYLLDEMNGILLPGTMESGHLSFRYQVNEVLYEVLYDLSTDGQIFFDLRFYHQDKAVQVEKNTIQGYIPAGRQYASMKKAD